MPTTPRSRFTSRTRAAARFVAQRGLLKSVVWTVVKVKVVGTEKLTTLRRPFVAVSNHSSHLDAPLIMGALPRRLARYLAAGAAGDYFFDVWWRRGLTSLFFNAFPIDRTGSNPRNVNATTLVQHEVPVLLFPEGTRSRNGELGRFKPGAASLATMSDVPILPIAIIGAHEAHPRGSKWPKSGRHPVAVIFAEPMSAHEGETAIAFIGRVRTTIDELRVEYTPRILGENHAKGERA